MPNSDSIRTPSTSRTCPPETDTSAQNDSCYLEVSSRKSWPLKFSPVQEPETCRLGHVGQQQSILDQQSDNPRHTLASQPASTPTMGLSPQELVSAIAPASSPRDVVFLQTGNMTPKMPLLDEPLQCSQPVASLSKRLTPRADLLLDAELVAYDRSASGSQR